MGEYPRKEHGKNIVMGTLVDAFLQIDPRLGGVSFLWAAVADHILHRGRE
jgi:hypothetical protein